MIQKLYELEVQRTLPNLGHRDNIIHMILGIQTEIAEYLSSRNNDELNKQEELGDILWYVYNYSTYLGRPLMDYTMPSETAQEWRRKVEAIMTTDYFFPGWYNTMLTQRISRKENGRSDKMFAHMLIAKDISDHLVDDAKRWLAYGKEPNIDTLTDGLAVIQLATIKESVQIGIEIEDCYEKVIAKLRKRFPDKFDADKALNRDLTVEKQAMEATELLKEK